MYLDVQVLLMIHKIQITTHQVLKFQISHLIQRTTTDCYMTTETDVSLMKYPHSLLGL